MFELKVKIEYWTDYKYPKRVADYSIQVAAKNWMEKVKEELDKIADTQTYIKSISFSFD